MQIYPAIDLSDGQIVRLKKGDFSKKTIYSDNIIAQAKDFESDGAKWIHTVDLDGANLGKGKNKLAVQEIINNTECKIQLGGGIRSLKDIEEWINYGVSRVVIGTAAIKNSGLVEEANKLFPGKIAVGLDLFNNQIAIEAWKKIVKEKTAEYFFKKFADVGVAAIIYTDINRDGLLKGPNIKKTYYFKKLVNVPIIASGGISNLEDIKKLHEHNIYGAIVGKAIYEKKIELSEVFDMFKNA